MSLKKSVLLAFLTLVLSIPYMWYTTIMPYAASQEFFQAAPQYFETIVAETYPEDLEILVTNGVVELNRPTPYCLILNQKTRSGILFDPNFNIELFTPTLASTYPLCAPIAVVGESSVITAEKNATGYTVHPISPSTNIIINKPLIDGVTKSSLPILLQWGWFLYLGAPVILIPLVLLAILLINIWYAMINKIIFSLMDNDMYMHFKPSYALSLRFFTLLIIGYICLNIFNNYTNSALTISFPFLNTIIISICSIVWVKFGPDSKIIQAGNGQRDPNIDSHAIPAPAPQTGISVADEGKPDGYGFDPTVISQPTEKKSIES